MERNLWNALYEAVMTIDYPDPARRVSHSDRRIVLTYLWAVVHDRPTCWACNPNNWPEDLRLLVNRLAGEGYLVGDSSYDSNPLHETASRGHHQLVAPPKKKDRGLGHRPHSVSRLRALELLRHPFGEALYRSRSLVERSWGHLTSFGGGLGPLPSWVRRLHRVKGGCRPSS